MLRIGARVKVYNLVNVFKNSCCKIEFSLIFFLLVQTAAPEELAQKYQPLPDELSDVEENIGSGSFPSLYCLNPRFSMLFIDGSIGGALLRPTLGVIPKNLSKGD